MASLAALLAGHLTRMEAAALIPGDRAACQEAACAAETIRHLMARDDNPGPG